MNHSYADLLKKYRKEKKLSQYELAKQLGKTQQAIANYENGKNKVDSTVLLLLSHDIDWLRIIYNIS